MWYHSSLQKLNMQGVSGTAHHPVKLDGAQLIRNSFSGLAIMAWIDTYGLDRHLGGLAGNGCSIVSPCLHFSVEWVGQYQDLQTETLTHMKFGMLWKPVHGSSFPKIQFTLAFSLYWNIIFGTCGQNTHQD